MYVKKKQNHSKKWKEDLKDLEFFLCYHKELENRLKDLDKIEQELLEQLKKNF